MGTQVILGAGAIGRSTAGALVEAGHDVKLVSRSGSGSGLVGVEVVAADVVDSARLTQICAGADTVVNALNPSQYWKWEELWPPMARSILAAAEGSGAGLVTVGNLYPYGHVDGPMTEQNPVTPNGRKGEVRATMWSEALALHDSGRIRATEVRSSDYVGAGMGAQSYLNSFVIKPAMAGRSGWLVIGDPDAAHTWTAGRDVARLVARLAGAPADAPSWGRLWHVPSAPPRSMAQVAQEVAELVGQPVRRPRRVPRAVVAALGAFSPTVRELRETRHQFETPFVLDSRAASTAFGLEATPWESTLRETVQWLSETAA